MMPATRVLALLLLLPFSANAQAIYAENRRPSGNVEIEYTLAVTEPLSHLYNVTLVIRGMRTDTVDVAMPAWSPGVYYVVDYARNIQQFQAASAQGALFRWEKVDKQTWRIAKQAGDDVRVTYQAYSADLTDEVADLASPAVFMYVVGQKHAPVSVRFTVPSQWRVFTGLEQKGDRFVASDYDVFVDAPAFMGDLKTIEFESANRTPHRVVISNMRLQMTDRQVIADLKDLADAAARVFGKAPYRDYTFLVKVGAPAGSIQEHLNSSRITVGADDFVNQTAYRRFLNNAAHAIVHVWNGKRVRPAAFAPLDYSKESYTKLLWFFEGATTYYAGRIQLQSGLLTPADYLSRLSSIVDALQHQAGRRSTTLEEASWNAWLRPDNALNNVAFYAIKGEVAAFLLDLEIRGRTKNDKSLDDVMRRLVSDYAERGIGVPEDGLRRVFESVAGSAFGEFYDRVVRSTDELEYTRILNAAGLRTDIFRQPSSIYFGIEFERAENNQVRIRRVAANSPAERAMLDAGDVLVAMDAERTTFDNLTSRIHSKRIGKSVELTVLRGDRLLSLTLVPGESQDEQWSIVENANATPDQARIRNAWLQASSRGQ